MLRFMGFYPHNPSHKMWLLVPARGKRMNVPKTTFIRPWRFRDEKSESDLTIRLQNIIYQGHSRVNSFHSFYFTSQVISLCWLKVLLRNEKPSTIPFPQRTLQNGHILLNTLKTMA